MTLRSNKRYQNTVYLQSTLGVDNDGNEYTLMDILSTNEDSVFRQAELSILKQNLLKLIREHLNDGTGNYTYALRLGGRFGAPYSTANGKEAGDKPQLYFAYRKPRVGEAAAAYPIVARERILSRLHRCNG